MIVSLLLAAAVSAPCDRWMGGVSAGDDYTAAVVRLEARTAAFPNQRHAVRFSSVVREGEAVRMAALPDERWEGRIGAGTFRGSWNRGGESGTFDLVCAPDVAPQTLRAADGTYRFDDDGSLVRLAFVPRITDELLVYFDPAANDERWLFPTSPTTFAAGPSFERPAPIERRFELTADGFRVVHGAKTRTARRVPPKVEIATGVLADFLREHDVPGVTAGIVTRDGLSWARGAGFADRERGIEATAETAYQIGSVTKVFTATLLMALVERGVVRLDDPVSQWLPPDAAPPKTITLRDLVTHVSGLPPNPINRVDRDGVMQPYSVAELLAGLRGTVLQSEPGARWSYSNLGFALLGHVLARAAGKPFEALLREHVTEPLGMRSTAIADPRELAVHYWPEDRPRKPRPPWRFGEVAAFGGLTSSVPDLARFVALHLSDPKLARMQQPRVMLGAWEQGMGLGWMTRRRPDGTIAVYHGGEVDGHSSFVAFSPANRVAVIVLANLGGSTAEDLGWRMFAQALEQMRQQTVLTRAEAFGAFFRGEWADAAAALERIANGAPDDAVVRSRLETARAKLPR